MPNIDLATVRKLAAMQRRYADSLARQAAERRLDELDAALQHERQRRGMAPIMSDDGAILGWVHTRPQTPGGA